MKTKVFCMFILCCCMMACEKNEPSKKISGTASVLSSSGRTSCEWVQLWAGGPKWATFNVGSTITDYANLTAGKDPTSGNEAYYNTTNVGGLYPWNNPNLNGRQTTWAQDTVSTGIADVATILWGSNWKTPTKEQWSTLQDTTYTTWTWCNGNTTQYVHGCKLKGYEVSGKGEYAGYSIFLPAAGWFSYGTATVRYSGYYGLYWSSTMYESVYAYNLDFASNSCIINYGNIESGLPIRAILAE